MFHRLIKLYEENVFKMKKLYIHFRVVLLKVYTDSVKLRET